MYIIYGCEDIEEIYDVEVEVEVYYDKDDVEVELAYDMI